MVQLTVEGSRGRGRAGGGGSTGAGRLDGGGAVGVLGRGDGGEGGDDSDEGELHFDGCLGIVEIEKVEEI